MSIDLGDNLHGRRKKIISVEEILENNRKMMGRPKITVSDLSSSFTSNSLSLGNKPKRYKTQKEINKAAVLADVASTELRRQVGQNQSLTNHFESNEYYNNQKRIFKPVFDALTNTTIDPITGLKKEDSMASILAQVSKQLEELPAKQTEAMLAIAKQNPEIKTNLPIGISEKDLNEFLKHHNIEENPFNIKQIDINQGVFPAQGNLGIDPDTSYFELLPRNEKIRKSINLIKDRLPLQSWELTEALWVVLIADVTEVSEFARETYLEMVDLMMGNEIRNLVQSLTSNEEGEPDFSEDGIRVLQLWYQKSKNNGKFRSWIVPRYQIPSEEELSQYLKSDDGSDSDLDNTQPPSDHSDSDSDSNSDSDSTSLQEKEMERLSEAIDKGHVETRKKKVSESDNTQPKSSKNIKEEVENKIDLKQEKDGDGLPKNKKQKKKVRPPKIIIISPNSEERLQRLNVLLGSKTAGNNVGLDEFTSILDSLLKDGKFKKKDYSRFMKAWNYKQTEHK